MSDQARDLVTAIADMDEDTALPLAKAMLDGGHDPLNVLALCREAMEEVGRRFESGRYFLPELMLAGDMLQQVGDMAKPLIKAGGGGEAKTLGCVLIGTVKGDLHDIGKNIVTFMLDINGYEVIDLGIDVPPQTFVEAIRKHKPQVVGLSGFLTLAYDSMKETIDLIAQAGLRDGLKIAIGGGQVDEQVRAYTGADAFGSNATSAVALCREWIAA